MDPVITEINGNPYDLNVTFDDLDGRTLSYGVWLSDRGRWAAANIDGHVAYRSTKEEAIAWCHVNADCTGLTAAEALAYLRQVAAQGDEAGFSTAYVEECRKAS